VNITEKCPNFGKNQYRLKCPYCGSTTRHHLPFLTPKKEKCQICDGEGKRKETISDYINKEIIDEIRLIQSKEFSQIKNIILQIKKPPLEVDEIKSKIKIQACTIISKFGEEIPNYLTFYLTKKGLILCL
jgi:hypothetical protein